MKKQKEVIEAYKKVIKNLKKGYGERCTDYNRFCAGCQAWETIDLLERDMKWLQEELKNTCKATKKKISKTTK